MKSSSKHRGLKRLKLTDFKGGLNFNVSPENLEPNELWRADNVEFDPLTGTLKLRAGTIKVLDTTFEIDTFQYIRPLGIFLISSGQDLYQFDGINSVSYVGKLSGSKEPKFKQFGNKVLIASGGKLQSYDGINLTTINSPNCDGVAVRNGRVVIWRKGDDNLYFSGVGDETNWNFNGTDADAQYIEIGYKDGGDIETVEMLNKDLIVFKDNARVYRLVGDYPNWVVYSLSKNAKAVNRFSVKQIGNDLFFIDTIGIRKLSTVVEYGDIEVQEAGYKVNSYLREEINPVSAKMFHHFKNHQVWIKANNINKIWVYHYLYNSWTIFKYPFEIKGIAITEDDVFIASNNAIYRVSDFEDKDDGQRITGTVGFKRIEGLNDFVIKRVGFAISSSLSGLGIFQAGKMSFTFRFYPNQDVAYVDSDIAYYDTDPVVSEKVKEYLAVYDNQIAVTNIKPINELVFFTIKKRCNQKVSEIPILLHIYRGALNFHSIFIEYVEVN